MPHISAKFLQMKESQTVALTRLAAEMVQHGHDVLALNVGEPDFDTPQHIKQAAISAIEQGYTKYTSADGMSQLRQAIASWIKEMYGPAYSQDEIIVTNGAKQAVAQAIFCVCDAGDEVLIPVPYWVSYPEQVKLAGAVPKFLPTSLESGFKITAAQLESAITANTRLLILNSPSNPSGAVYQRHELQNLVDVIRDHGIYILADEVYDQISFGDHPFSSLASFASIKENLLYVNGLSKSFAMTGWRLGFLAAPSEIADAVRKFQGHFTSNASTISQHAGLAAYVGEKAFLKDMVMTFQKRRDLVVERMNSIPKVHCPVPDGAFYAFPDVSAYLMGGVKSTAELCRYLLQDYNVALVPGVAFGMDGHVRISYATEMDTLNRALDRIEEGLNNLT